MKYMVLPSIFLPTCVCVCATWSCDTLQIYHKIQALTGNNKNRPADGVMGTGFLTTGVMGRCHGDGVLDNILRLRHDAYIVMHPFNKSILCNLLLRDSTSTTMWDSTFSTLLRYSTVTDLARLRGLSTSQWRATAA